MLLVQGPKGVKGEIGLAGIKATGLKVLQKYI